jgi:hypothetical protein
MHVQALFSAAIGIFLISSISAQASTHENSVTMNSVTMNSVTMNSVTMNSVTMNGAQLNPAIGNSDGASRTVSTGSGKIVGFSLPSGDEFSN